MLLGATLLFRRHKQVQSQMASSSTADVLDEATTTLIVGIKNMKESKTPQQIEDYIHKLQSLGRHMQLQQFRTWLKDQCGLPIAVRPSNLNTKEYMSKEQIEQWIEDWTTQHAQGNERRVLKNFLLMVFAVQPNQKMQPCSNCEQPFMLFMLLPMKQHNMNMYDPDEHKLFCYNCCTEVGQMLHPGRYVPPDQQAIERQKALNEHYQEIEATSHRPGTLPLHQEQPYHQTMPSSSTAGTPRLRSGSSYPSPRQAKTTRPHSTLPTNGSFW